MAKGRPVAPARPGVRFAPDTLASLRRGVDQLTDLVRPTLGPRARCVALNAGDGQSAPEVLDDAALILRRVIQIPDPYADMGAMLLRHAVWRTYEAVGDGGATTAVLTQAILRHATPYLAAGVHPATLTRGLERGRAAAVASLREQGRPLTGATQIARAAEMLCHDPALAAMLGEAFESAYPDGAVQVEDGYGRGLELSTQVGCSWTEGYCSPAFATDSIRREAVLEDPLVMVSDLALTTAGQVVPLLRRLASSDRTGLLSSAREVSGDALRLLTANHEVGALRLLAVRAPASGPHQVDVLSDIAVLTGARFLADAAGDRAEDVRLVDLGRACSVIASVDMFTLIGGAGDSSRVQRRIGHIRAELQGGRNPAELDRARERLSTLSGRGAIIKVGAATRIDREARKVKAERAVKILRLALAQGVVPGAGTAYLTCRSAIEALSAPSGERIGLCVLCAALAEPLAVIAQNAGYEPAKVVAAVEAAPQDWGFDVRSGTSTDMWPVGLVDPLPVLEHVLRGAVSTAVSILTTEVLVHHREPEVVFEP